MMKNTHPSTTMTSANIVTEHRSFKPATEKACFLACTLEILVQDGNIFGALFNILSYTSCGHISFNFFNNISTS